MKTIRTVLFSVLFAVVVIASNAGCAAVSAALPEVIAAVTDGAQILDAIAGFVNAYFISHPDPAAQQKVTDAIVKARSALNVALRTAQGAKNLDNASVDAAFEDFKTAYLELLALVKPYGVKEAGLPSMKMRAEPGTLIVPQPLAFKKGAR